MHRFLVLLSQAQISSGNPHADAADAGEMHSANRSSSLIRDLQN